MAYRKLSIDDFRFKPTGYGRYEVTYISPKIGKQWKTSITDMSIIDATKNAEEPNNENNIYNIGLHSITIRMCHN